MDSETSPTEAQCLWVYALDGLYNKSELSPSQRRRAEEIVASNEISPDEKEDFAIVARHLLSENGRWKALQTLYGNFSNQHDSGGDLDEWYFVSMAEFAEIQRLVREEEFDTAIVRGCSFVEHFVKENVNWFRYTPIEFEPEKEPSFAELINFIRKSGFIGDLDQKLLHFAREVRNRTAHHAWLTQELDIELALIAGRALLYEINRLLEEKADRDDVSLPEFRTDPDRAAEYIDRVEEQHGWTYLDHQKYWVP